MGKRQVCHCIFLQGLFVAAFGLAWSSGLDMTCTGQHTFLEDSNVSLLAQKMIFPRFIRIATFSTIINDLVQLC